MRRLPTMMLTLSMAAALAACGSSSSGGSSGGGSGTPSAQPTAGAAAQAAITTLYETFFSAPIPQAETLIEDGSTLGAAFKAAAKLQKGATEAAKVKSVTLTGPTTADVLFELDMNGSPVIPSSDGKAVYINGKWVVAKQTFCTLVDLGVSPAPAGC